MININKVKRKISNEQFEITENTSVIKRDVIYPKGIISHPNEDEHTLTISIGKGFSKNYIIPIVINKDDDLEEGDVMITDGKSKVHLKYKDGVVEFITKKLTIKAEDEVIIDGKTTFNKDTVFKGSMEHDGKKVDSTHTHDFDIPSSGTPEGGGSMAGPYPVTFAFGKKATTKVN